MIATAVFGMCTDCPDILRVMHWGLPSTMKEYIRDRSRGNKMAATARKRSFRTLFLFLLCFLLKLSSLYRLFSEPDLYPPPDRPHCSYTYFASHLSHYVTLVVVSAVIIVLLVSPSTLANVCCLLFYCLVTWRLIQALAMLMWSSVCVVLVLMKKICYNVRPALVGPIAPALRCQSPLHKHIHLSVCPLCVKDSVLLTSTLVPQVHKLEDSLQTLSTCSKTPLEMHCPPLWGVAVMQESVSSFSSALIPSKSPSRSPPLPSKTTTVSVGQTLPATFSVSPISPLPTYGKSHVTYSHCPSNNFLSKRHSPNPPNITCCTPYKPPLLPPSCIPYHTRGFSLE